MVHNQHRPLRTGNSWGRAIAPLAVLLVLVFYPLGVLMLQVFLPKLFGFHPQAVFSLSAFTGLIHDASFWRAATNSLLLGLSVAVAGSAIGVAIGYVLARVRPWKTEMWMNILWLMFFTPSFLYAQGIEIFALPHSVGASLGLMPSWFSNLIFSPVGVFAVLTLKLMPYSAIVVRSALESVGREFDDAAKTLGAGRWQRAVGVHLPLVQRAVLAGFAIIFAEAVGDFGVPATLGVASNFNLVPYNIFSALGTFPADFASAAAQAFLLVFLALLVQFPQLLLGDRGEGVLHGRRRQMAVGRESGWAAAGLGVFFLAVLGAPVISFALVALVPALGVGFGPSHWSLHNFLALGQGMTYTGPALVRSYILSISAAAIVTALGLWIMFAGKRLSSLYDMLLTTTIAMPGIVLAAAYVFAFHAPWLQGTPFALYGTVWVLVMAYLAAGLPFAGRLARVGLGQVHDRLVSAVHTLGGTEWTALFKVVLPLMRPMLVSTFLLLFTNIFFELPMSELLYPAGQPTLAVAILHDFNNFEYGTASALSVLGLLAVGITLVVFRLVDRMTAEAWRGQREEEQQDVAQAEEPVEVVW